MRVARQGLDGGEDDIGLGVLLFSIVAPEPGAGTNGAEGGHRLGQDFLTMRHEQDAGRVRAVEGGKEGLAQSRGQNHKARAIALGPCRLQRR